MEAHRAVVESEPANARHRYNLALSLRGAGRHDAALAELDTALRLEPSLAVPQVDRAMLRLERGEWERAWADPAWSGVRTFRATRRPERVC